MDEVEAERQTELLAKKMWRCAGPRRSKVVLSGIEFNQGGEILDALHRQRWMDGQHCCRGDGDRHRVEVAERVVWDLAIQCGVDDQIGRDDEHRVAVGCGLRTLTHSDVAAGTADILYVKLLSEVLRQLLCDYACEDVGRTAGRVGNDHTHGSGGVNFCPCRARDDGEYGSTRCKVQKSPTCKVHGVPLVDSYRDAQTPFRAAASIAFSLTVA